MLRADMHHHCSCSFSSAVAHLFATLFVFSKKTTRVLTSATVAPEPMKHFDGGDHQQLNGYSKPDTRPSSGYSNTAFASDDTATEKTQF